MENLQRGGPRPRRERNGRQVRDPPRSHAAGPARLAIQPPPGLAIRNVDERSEVSSTTRGPLHHQRQHLPRDGLHWPDFNFHYFVGPNTQGTMRSETNMDALDLHQADSFELPIVWESEERILILAEIDRVLMSLASQPSKEHAAVMPNGKKYLYVRPGAKELWSGPRSPRVYIRNG